MSEVTPRMGLPLIAANQAQKHVPVNEALARLDALVHLAVLGRTLELPPATPAAGDRYIVGATPAGAWAGQSGNIAAYDAGWIFLQPAEGWFAWDEAASELLVHTDGAWQVFSSGGGGSSDELQNVNLFGLGDEADETNPFLAKLNTALWTARESGEGGTGDLRYIMNKQTSAGVLSLLLQSGFGGRAEIGLIGDDDLLLKVSADGTVWREALRIDKASGRASFPQGGVRDQLSANRTYYVRHNLGSCTIAQASPTVVTKTGHGLATNAQVVFSTTGALPAGLTAGTVYYVRGVTANTFELSAAAGGPALNTSSAGSGTHSVATGNDAASGLSDTAADALLTPAAAQAIIENHLDLAGFAVTVQLADSTYTGSTIVSAGKPPPGGVNASITYRGNPGSPADVLLSATGACFSLRGGADVTITGMRLTCPISGSTINLSINCVLRVGTSVDLGFAPGGAHFMITNNGIVAVNSNYSVSGSAGSHINLDNGATFVGSGRTVTLLNTPSFSGAFLVASRTAVAACASMTFSGTATGKRYDVLQNAVVNTGSGGANYFPGDVAGTASTGLYV